MSASVAARLGRAWGESWRGGGSMFETRSAAHLATLCPCNRPCCRLADSFACTPLCMLRPYRGWKVPRLTLTHFGGVEYS